MKILIYILVSILSFSALSDIHGNEHSEKQNYVEISLAEALEKVQSQNFDIRKSLTDLTAAKSRLNGANSIYLPSVTLSENFVRTNDPLNVFGFKLKQGITTADDFNPDLLNNPNNISNFNTRIEVSQPLLNADGIVQRSAIKDYYNASEKALKRTRQQVKYEVKRLYAELWLAFSSISIMETRLVSARESYNTTLNSFQEGFLLESDVLGAELLVLDLETQLEQARNRHLLVSDQLKFVLQIDQAIPLVPKNQPEITISSAPYHKAFDASRRSDLQALNYQLSGAQKMLKSSKYRYIPRLNAQLGYEWNDASIFGTGADNYLLGVSLQWKIFDGYRNISEMQQKRAELERLSLQYEEKKARIDLELRKAIKSYSIAQRNLELATKSVARAEDLLRIKKNRHVEGLENTADLLASESQMASREVAKLNAMYQVLLSKYQIELLTEQNNNE
jgi:outer membrane protein TolC